MSYDDWKAREPASDHGCPECGRDGDFRFRQCVCEAKSIRELEIWQAAVIDTIEGLRAVNSDDDGQIERLLRELSDIEDEIERRS
jgi:hypothetical protein